MHNKVLCELRSPQSDIKLQSFTAFPPPTSLDVPTSMIRSTQSTYLLNIGLSSLPMANLTARVRAAGWSTEVALRRNNKKRCGVGVGVGVNATGCRGDDPVVEVGVGVGAASPRLRTPGQRTRSSELDARGGSPQPTPLCGPHVGPTRAHWW